MSRPLPETDVNRLRERIKNLERELKTKTSEIKELKSRLNEAENTIHLLQKELRDVNPVGSNNNNNPHHLSGIKSADYESEESASFIKQSPSSSERKSAWMLQHKRSESLKSGEEDVISSSPPTSRTMTATEYDEHKKKIREEVERKPSKASNPEELSSTPPPRPKRPPNRKKTFRQTLKEKFSRSNTKESSDSVEPDDSFIRKFHSTYMHNGGSLESKLKQELSLSANDLPNVEIYSTQDNKGEQDESPEQIEKVVMHVTAIKPEEDDEEEEESKMIPTSKRDRIVREIVDTERSYVEGLKKAVHMYFIPLNYAANSEHEILTSKEISTIFQNLPVIYNFAKQMLHSLNEALISWDPDNTKIADVFLVLTPFLKSYNDYSKNYSMANDLFHKLSESNAKFKKFILTQKKLPNNDLDLVDYLIMPVQRLPRYVMLLEDLKKNTLESHPDYKDIVSASQVMNKIVDEMNNNIKLAENVNKVLLIQRSFNDQVVLVEPHRTFVNEASVTIVNLANQKRINGTVFLFNDILVLAKRGLLQGYQLEDKIYLVSSTFGPSNYYLGGVEIHFSKKSYALLFKSLQERDAWLHEINKNKSILIEKEGIFMLGVMKAKNFFMVVKDDLAARDSKRRSSI